MGVESWICAAVALIIVVCFIAYSIEESTRRKLASQRAELESSFNECERRRVDEWSEWQKTETRKFEEWKAREIAALERDVERVRRDLERIAEEKTIGFPWLADAYADYFYLEDMRKAHRLKVKQQPIPRAVTTVLRIAEFVASLQKRLRAELPHTGTYPAWLSVDYPKVLCSLAQTLTQSGPRAAPKAAAQLRQSASARREAEAALRVHRYQVQYYETLFPWLAEFKEEGIDELISQGAQDQSDESTIDPARKWLTAAEYQKLSDTERYQMALDRYQRRRMNRWQVGRAYERYVGYLYESRSYRVEFQGIIAGFADLGRDLVAFRSGEVEIVQCKCWSRSKTIHEKHVFQLYGTVTAFRLDHPLTNVKGRFMTSTSLSDRAKQFAAQLEIDVDECHELQPYPCIKCNVARGTNERIYHLPFDQQYDKIAVEPERGECYVGTVAEAEALGFRRAHRWHQKEA